MNKRYSYNEYLLHCIWEPISLPYYNKISNKGISLYNIISRKYTKSIEYEFFYLPWCYKNFYAPFDIYTYRRLLGGIYRLHHSTYDESSIDHKDIKYIKSIKRDCIKRKSYMNQNMILFYKNYFRRKWNSQQNDTK